MPAAVVDLPSTAYVFVSHILDRPVLREYERLASAVNGLGTPWFVYQGEPECIKQWKQPGNLFVVRDQDIGTMNFPMLSRGIYPGSTQFPFLKFFLSHPDYDEYWMIEYDVRFTGNWRSFFIECNSLKADFLSPHICNYQDEPEWYRWTTLAHPVKNLPLVDRLRCFHPIMRISKAALKSLCDDQRDGWCGHNETLIPTLLGQRGFSLTDFGGEGSFVPAGWQNRFYTSSPPNPKGLLKTGTFRFRPSFVRPGMERNKLYHPVKPLRMVWKEKVRNVMDSFFGKAISEKIIVAAKKLLGRDLARDDV